LPRYSMDSPQPLLAARPACGMFREIARAHPALRRSVVLRAIQRFREVLEPLRD
jgi:hypothetical protein